MTPERARQVQEAARRSVASLRGELAGTLVEELVAQLQTHQKAENRLRKLLIQAYQALPASAHIQAIAPSIPSTIRGKRI
ncbi:MAG: hypothetical protein ACYC0Y_06010, partial [Pirellulales bacterium]